MPSSKYFAIFETMWNSSSLEQETTKWPSKSVHKYKNNMAS